jgi:hypothetical protein
LEHATRELPFGWVFFYQSRRHLETGDISHALAGSAPYIVNRVTGAVVPTGTAHPIGYYVSRYEASLR